MWDRLYSFVTTKCPMCHYRYGMRAQRRPGDRFLGLLGIYPFECRGCNIRFHAIVVCSNRPPESLPASNGIGRIKKPVNETRLAASEDEDC